MNSWQMSGSTSPSGSLDLNAGALSLLLASLQAGPGCKALEMGYLSYWLNRVGYIQELDALRDQMGGDVAAPVQSFSARLVVARTHLQALATYEPLLPAIRPVLLTLEKAVEDFYRDSVHRGLSHEFALEDLKKLEDIWPEDRPGISLPPPSASPPGAGYGNPSPGL